MQRRLGIAQAILHSPRLVVVDEPTAGLDPEERIRFRNLITDVAASTTVLLSTHIVEDVEATCPRLGVIARRPAALRRRADRAAAAGRGAALAGAGRRAPAGRRRRGDPPGRPPGGDRAGGLQRGPGARRHAAAADAGGVLLGVPRPGGGRSPAEAEEDAA